MVVGCMPERKDCATTLESAEFRLPVAGDDQNLRKIKGTVPKFAPVFSEMERNASQITRIEKAYFWPAASKRLMRP